MRKLLFAGCFILSLSVVVGWQESRASEDAEASAGELTRYDASTKSFRILGFDSLWYGKGRELFDQKCKVCHTRKNNVGAPFLHTESLSPKRWNQAFSTRYPKCAKSGEWQISQNEQLLINDYLYRYGADTYDARCEL